MGKIDKEKMFELNKITKEPLKNFVVMEKNTKFNSKEKGYFLVAHNCKIKKESSTKKFSKLLFQDLIGSRY